MSLRKKHPIRNIENVFGTLKTAENFHVPHAKYKRIILCGMFDFENRRIHFIGIGGVGVNALAKFCIDFGAIVSGSDIKLNSLCEDIIARGGEVWQGENSAKMADAELVVYSSAIKNSNQELQYALQNDIQTLERYEFLGIISSMFGKVIAIAGTHGKTTTTAMLTHIMTQNDISFVSMIGGECVNFGNYVNNIKGDGHEKRDSRGDIFLCEACEYRQSLLSLKPTIAVVTNAECDHPDCYKDINSVNIVFEKFFEQSRICITSNKYAYLLGKECETVGESNSIPDGESIVVRNGCDGDIEEYINEDINNDIYRCKFERDESIVVSDGSMRSYPCNFVRDENGICGVETDDGTLRLKDDGDYNYMNAVYAMTVASIIGIPKPQKCLETYRGVKRRFEEGKRIENTRVFFDFAHHPTEIGCVLDRARKYGKMLVVFQPHTYSRTKAYLDDFAKVFCKECVDTLVLMPTYSAREDKSQGVDIDKLADAIFDKNCKKQVYLATSAQSTIDYVKNNAKLYDVILFAGAGDIYALKDKY